MIVPGEPHSPGRIDRARSVTTLSQLPTLYAGDIVLLYYYAPSMLYNRRRSRRGNPVGLRSLENKKLALVITSYIDIDYSMLCASYMRAMRAHPLWIPIVDDPTLWNTAAMENNYRTLASMLKLHTLKNVQKSIASGFTRFVKKKFFPTFQIGGGPIIVLLDHQGKMVLCIPTHMILKRSTDFFSKGGVDEFMKKDSKVPLFKNMVKEMTLSVRHLVSDIDEKISDFANEMNSKLEEWCHGIESDIKNSFENIMFKAIMEEDPWKEKTWCTNLLIRNNISIAQAKEWVNANEHIFFIGGKDIKWVKTFASWVLREIHNPQLTIKMVYVGSNNKVTLTIREERICETFDGRIRAGFIFWMILQSMFLSRIKFLYETYGDDEESDEIVKGLKFLLSYETEGVGWALLCKGNKIVLYDLGDKMLAVMNEYEKWKESAIIKGFDQAFKDHHHEMFGSTCIPQHHPYALEYPSNSDKVPENIKCPQCCHNMQKFVTFKCDHGHSMYLHTAAMGIEMPIHTAPSYNGAAVDVLEEEEFKKFLGSPRALPKFGGAITPALQILCMMNQ
nr:protein SIEVE ELEMENT OCCLUSION B-like [Ipomoea batatas]